MKVHTYPLGQLQTNCYIIENDGECLIIDPGDSADFILEQIQRKNLQPIAILLTHGHFDHVMAAGEIQLSFPIPCYLFPEDEFLIRRLKATAKHFLGYEQNIFPPTIKNLQIGNMKVDKFLFEVIPTPGHTPGSCCFYFKTDGFLFTGDTLFKDAIGEYSHAYSSLADLKRSMSRLFVLPEETEVYSGHGEITTILAEKNRY